MCRYTKGLTDNGMEFILAPNAVPLPRSNLGQQSYLRPPGAPHALSGSVDMRGCSPSPGGWTFTLRRSTDGAVCTLAGAGHGPEFRGGSGHWISVGWCKLNS